MGFVATGYGLRATGYGLRAIRDMGSVRGAPGEGPEVERAFEDVHHRPAPRPAESCDRAGGRWPVISG